ncbi:MAG: SLC13 family permease [Candidatus Eisenbacteria bacterium]
MAALISGLTYAVLAFGSLRPLRLDRAGAALVGATAMVAAGVLTPAQAVAAVDFHTLALLFGVMVVVAHLRLAGFFRWLAARTLVLAHAPRTLLTLGVVVAGVLSALFVNDTIYLLLTPLVLEATAGLGYPPVPFLLAVAMGANVGSVATIVGNPQEMFVAGLSGISYPRFAMVLAPVAVAGLALTAWFLGHAFRRELAAFAPASALLITRRLKPVKVYAQVDWALLAIFAGPFVVVEGIERSGLARRWLALLDAGRDGSLAALVGVTAVMSHLVSNVPAGLLLKGVAGHGADPDRTWLALAMASTLAVDLTRVGSVANLIVVEQARGRAEIGFWTYARVGVPLTPLTLALGTCGLLLATPRGRAAAAQPTRSITSAGAGTA